MVAGAIIHINFLMPAASRLKSLTCLRYMQRLWLKLNTTYRLAFVYWRLPNYQQNLFNAMVTSFLISASSLLRLLYIVSNFSINLNILLLLLSCCKSLDFTSFNYIQHIKIFHSHQLRAPKTAVPGAAAPLAPPKCGTAVNNYFHCNFAER